MTRQIAILGSTGSIGKNALRVVDGLGADYAIGALSAHRNIELLAEQARQYRPRAVAVTDPHQVDAFLKLIPDLKIEVLSGLKALERIARTPEFDTVLSAIVGAAGLPSVLAAAGCGKRLAIANKEPLVIAGELLMATAKAHGSTVLPIDSEHSAVFQALQAGSPEQVQRIILTGSGGPFRQLSTQDLQDVTLDQALAHPTWNMGPKITIDSATMMNKALEIIEAHWLFRMPVTRIDVLIHPESIVHSMVEFVDGALVAQLGPPDMCLPIQYALTYPNRCKGITEHLKLEQLGQLTFESPNCKTFRALPLAYQVAQAGGTAAAVFNAANESAVKAFLDGAIKLTRIVDLVEHCLDKHDIKQDVGLEDLLEADAWARDQVKKNLNTRL